MPHEVVTKWDGSISRRRSEDRCVFETAEEADAYAAERRTDPDMAEVSVNELGAETASPAETSTDPVSSGAARSRSKAR